MQNSKRYFRIGVLAAAALALLTGMMFFLGLSEEFAPRIHFVTTFNESVQGLTKGAAVKYKGVPIGTVDKITILPKEKIIRVDMLIDPTVFAGYEKIKTDTARRQKIYDFCEISKANGLCCFLELAGITGLRYIEMDYKPASQQRVKKLPEIKEVDTIYFPSAPNTFNNIVDSIRVSLEKIAKIDVNRLTDQLDSNLSALNTLLTDPALRSTVERLDVISKNIATITTSISENFTPEELEKLLEGVNENLKNISALTRELHEKLSAVNADKLTGQLENVLASSNQLLQALEDDSADVMLVIQQINSTVKSIKELVDDIKRDPSSLIRGKSADPIVLK